MRTVGYALLTGIATNPRWPTPIFGRGLEQLLGSLQARGCETGDELIIYSKSNERFLIAFWAAILGGLIPVPVAVGISDEHRHKLFRIARKLKNPTLFAEAEALDRLLSFAADNGIRRAQDLLRRSVNGTRR